MISGEKRYPAPLIFVVRVATRLPTPPQARADVTKPSPGVGARPPVSVLKAFSRRSNALVVFTLGTAAGRAFHTRAHLRPLAEAHERSAVAAVVHGRPAAVAAEAHERQAAAVVVHGRPAAGAAGAHERQAAAEPHERRAAEAHERQAAEAHERQAAVAGAHGRPAAVAGAHGRPAVVHERQEVVHERQEVAARSAQLPGQSKVD
jgi:hypothetical protein